MRDIALLLMAAEALVLLTLILRTHSRRWYRPRPGSDTATRRACRDAQRLVRELDHWAEKMDQKISVTLAELRELTDRAEAAAKQLRPGMVVADERPRAKTRRVPKSPAASEPPSELPPSTYASHAEVRRLSTSGLEPLAIARRLGRPVGEVELIIKLSADVNDRQGDSTRQLETWQAEPQQTS